MTFGKWPEAIHQTVDQQRRIVSARLPATMPFNVNKESFSGTFFGSQGHLYSTTLDSCTCTDFTYRKFPCKHIYRLAIECGLLSAELKPSNYPVEDFSIGESLEILEQYLDDTQIIIKNLFSYIIRNEAGIVRLECNKYGKVSKPISGLMLTDILSFPFFECSLTPTKTIMDKMPKKDIMKLLDQINSLPEEKMTKEKLITWCVNSLPYIAKDLPQIILLSCAPCFQKVLHKAYKYLRRKYEWDMLYVETDAGKDLAFYPSEAVFANSNICYFPDDEITEFLTKYGHNRCLEGFDITKQGPGK